MDLYWDKTTYENQYDAFRIQAKWAIERDLPVSIHSRDATQELIDLIVKEELNELRGVFHCFTGDETQARTIIDMGFYLGIGGVVTYKNSTLPDVLEKVGIEHLVLETDAPYLPPVPHRGKRNEPSYIPLIAEKLALIFKLSLAEVAEITTNNSRKVFGI
jgi:TatD DNase family protein